MKIYPLNALKDNYIWLIQKKEQVIIVDPSEAITLIDFFTKNQLNPTAILLTHHHDDHTSGVNQLKNHYPKIKVYGSCEVEKFTTHMVEDSQVFSLLDLTIKVIKTAGHTKAHISYLIDNQYLFCGDALFSAGCGRVFTSDYKAQYETLNKFNALSDKIKVYPAHEYTLSNLTFSEYVMPNNNFIKEYKTKIEKIREQNQPSLPSTIEIEKQINPFLIATSLDEFVELRKQKDNF